MANMYDIGDSVRCSVTFTDSDGNAVDPSTVVFRVKDPSGNVTAYTYGSDTEVVRDAAGQYHVDVVPDEAGTWYYRWEGSGTHQAASEGYFNVRRSNVI